MRITALLFPWALLAPLAAADVVLIPVAGDEIPVATLRLVAAGELEVGVGAETRRIPLDTVVRIEVRESRPAAELAENAVVRLVDGSELRGRLLAGGEDTIALETLDLGKLSLPIDIVDAASFGPPDARIDPALLSTTEAEDVVYRRGPVEGDVLTGTLTRVGAEGVEIDSELGLVTIEADRVLGIAVAPLEDAPRPRARRVELELVSGGLVVGDLVDLNSGGVRVSTLFRDPLVVSFRKLQRVRFASDRYSYLGDLEPEVVAETPFFGTDDEFQFHWQRDRSVTGRPLVVAGTRYGKGLGLHSRSRLTWRLAGEYRTLRGVAGISDEVLELGIRGSVVLRILVDGEQRFESDVIRAGENARDLPAIDLAGAELLTVEVDFADHGDVGDRAVLGEAILIRG